MLLTRNPTVQPVANLHEISEYSAMISSDEIASTLSKGRAALADAALNMGVNDLYKLYNNPCAPTNQRNLFCLYLYLYALDTWDSAGPNYPTEMQVQAILTKVQQISKTCCSE